MTAWDTELTSVSMAGHATAYARRGWAVIPIWWAAYPAVCACPDGKNCTAVAKHPLVSRGHLAATCDMEQVQAWWKRWPLANIGLATGEVSGFSVLDIDEGKGGQRSFDSWRRRYGSPEVTMVSLTGGGGRHILWRWREQHRCLQNVAPGVDVRSSGGYIVAPPSMHSSGIRYEWHEHGHPARVPLAQAPAWADNILSGKAKQKTQTASIPSGPIGEGGRNMTLFRYACRFQRQALEDEDLANQVHEINQRLCKPPLKDREVEKLISSAMRYPKGS